MHLDTLARGQPIEHRRSRCTGTVLSVEADRIRVQLSLTGKRITVIADPKQKEITGWRKSRRSHLALRALGVAR